VSPPQRRWTGIFSVLATTAIGLITNLITSSFTWALALSLAFLVVLSITIIWLESGHPAPPHGPTVTQRAESGGRIESGEIHAKGGASVREEARQFGRISRSKTRADGAQIEKVADSGTIEDQDIEAGP